MTILQPMNTSSPTSVRCSIDESTRTSLASSLKSLDVVASSEHEPPAFCDVSDDTTSSTCSSTCTTSSTRKVRFLPLVRAKDTLSRHDMTEEELKSCFLQDEDYDEIWNHNKRLLRRAKNYHISGAALPSPRPSCIEGFEDDIETKESGEFLCTRGLESTSRSHRQKSIDRVLVEQDFQDLEGYYDDEAIAEVYSMAAAPCKFRAVYLAMEDRIEAGVERQAAVDELRTINAGL